MREGTLSAIASHHQPHEVDAKQAPFANTEPGISSVEILLPLALTLVQDGLLDLPSLLARLTLGPAQALRLPVGTIHPGGAADLVIFDPQGQTLVGDEHWYSKGSNCPFINHCLPGRVHYTLMGGQLQHTVL